MLALISSSFFHRVWLHQNFADGVCRVTGKKVGVANLLQIIFDLRVAPDERIVCGAWPAVVNVIDDELVVGNDLKI
jgi:hypothetical protein